MDSLTRSWIPQAQRSTLTPRSLASCLYGGAGCVFRNLERAADERLDTHIAEQDVGIGHGRFRAAALIGGWAGQSTGRPWADIEQAQRVLGRDGTAAGTNLDHLDRLDLQRKARPLPETLVVGHLQLGADRRLAMRDQAKLGGRAAHVEGQHASLAGDPAEFGGGDGPCGRAGLDQAHRQLGGAAARNQSARGRHPENLAINALLGELALEMGHMARHLRPGIGIDDSRRGAVELANLRADFRRQRHEDVRVLFAQESRNALLVLRILIGVQQADGDRTDTLILELAGDFTNRLLLQFRDDVTAGGNAFAHAEAVRPADKRIGILDIQVIEIVTALVPDPQHVAETVCRDEAGFDALAFQNRVRDDRGRTQNLEVFEGDRLPELLEQFRDTLHHGLRRVLRRAQDLVEMKIAVVVQEGEIREGSSGVESQFCHVFLERAGDAWRRSSEFGQAKFPCR